jgi:hypothetical protein
MQCHCASYPSVARSLRTQGKQTCDQEDARSNFASKPDDMFPKTTSRALDASPEPRTADVLTRKSAADDIHLNTVCAELGGGKSFNVMIAGDLGPVLRQNAAAEGFDLAERDRLKTARALKALELRPDRFERGSIPCPVADGAMGIMCAELVMPMAPLRTHPCLRDCRSNSRT